MIDIVSGVLAAADSAPNRTALIAPGETPVTYGELGARVRTIAAALRGDGDFGVLFAVRPGPDAVALALGAVAAGGTLVLADPGLAPEVFAGRMALTRPRWVIAESLLYLLSGPLRRVARRRGLLLPNLREPFPDARHLYTGPWLPGVPRGATSLGALPGLPPGATGTGGLPGVPSSRAGVPGVPPGAAGTGGLPGVPPGGAGIGGLPSLPPGAAGAGLLGVPPETAGAGGPGLPRGAAGVGPGVAEGAGRPAVQAAGTWDQAAVVAFTSGTTERPKGVVHTRRSLAEGLRLFTEAVPMGPGDVVHTDQFILGLPALIAGATWSMPGRGDYAEELARRGATHAFSVPVKLHQLLERSPRLPATLRCLLLGAAPAPPAVLRRAREAAPTADILSVYALTEALPVAIASAEDKLATTGGDLLGAPLPGVRVRVADDGELFVSGPHLARGYLGDAPLAEVATGDLVRLDARGRLVLLGRKKDMILRDGVNIYPGVYEPAIAALPGVGEAAIVGLPDPDTGDEEVVLALTTTAGYDEKLLRRSLPGLMDAPALPDRIVTLADLPRSGRSDKLDRAAIRRQVAP
ncbi:class I adenylate-forming enzyme family protein [Nonomuraea sp. NPDC059194]|uniref:class I adenylate-forming enzyme family protein n=1 Tax=Nonomuraea sp. NPDC059194 TaxID=3346764 RepID=UPI0036BD624F